MLRRKSIVGSSTKKRLIHPYLMVWKDTRKTIGGDGILAIGTKPPNPSYETLSREFFSIGGPKKKGYLGCKYVSEGFGLKRLLLYLSRVVRVSFDSWPPTYSRSTLRTQSQSYVHRSIPMYARCLAKAYSPLFLA